MTIIKKEDIIGYLDTEGGIYCPACAPEELVDGAIVDQLVLESHRNEDDVLFCDGCRKQI